MASIVIFDFDSTPSDTQRSIQDPLKLSLDSLFPTSPTRPSLTDVLFAPNAGPKACWARYGYDAVRPQIRLSRHGFSGGLGLDGNGSFFADDDDDDGRRYTAAPSPEVDRAWYELLTGLNIDLEDPGEHLRRTTFRWPESRLYLTGLEVFHSLHCLDRLRQALYPEYYRHVFSNPNNPSREDHIGHCINHLRQAIQCHGDLTPMVWKLVGDKIILSTETRHMCRDFDRIHEWAAQRQTRFEDIQGIRNGSLFLVD
ncbi:Cyclochlorotine biosynthesis protein O [Colletotrichum trifolii]|uniref:Cyclochlorotine biosynthesis protein O n=1 Tax=Colletotrichum trifolii TaxID=5466 RepID=A0A4R8RES1_COLTR|nr:Cyclochlorotine biosynthesis protein O [Colletotrichum trifolii]